MSYAAALHAAWEASCSICCSTPVFSWRTSCTRQEHKASRGRQQGRAPSTEQRDARCLPEVSININTSHEAVGASSRHSVTASPRRMGAGCPNGQRLQPEPAVAGRAAARARPCLQAGIVGAADEVLVWDFVQIHGRLQELLELGQVLRIMVTAQRCGKSARGVSFSCTTGLSGRPHNRAECHCFECTGKHSYMPGESAQVPQALPGSDARINQGHMAVICLAG